MVIEKKRFLAAIMFTDMVGYTAQMQKDEGLAKVNRDRHRQVLQDHVQSHAGKILQYYGDGTLCVFESAVEAVRCAIKIQTELQKDPPIPLRVGIHAGDIVYDNEGVYGDAVNVASRIENLSVAGSVLISEKVMFELKNHPGLSAESLGYFNLKNVKYPMEIFAVSSNQLAIPDPETIKKERVREKKSIAVLPFVNMSADPENEYFSDGITEELLNTLSKIEGLQVTARTSSFAFKNRNIDVREIGTQLEVKTVLEGSVRKAGNKVRITAQLINTADGYHLWSETYDRQLDDIFATQDEISLKIAHQLRENLMQGSIPTGKQQHATKNVEAYNIYLKGLFHSNKWTMEDTKLAIGYFKQAIELDPKFALPYTGLADCYGFLGGSGKRLPAEVFPLSEKYGLKAIELDNTLSESYLSLISIYFWYYWDWDKTEYCYAKALELNPESASALQYKAMVQLAFGANDLAFELSKRSLQIDPLNVPANHCLSIIYYFMGEKNLALEQTNKTLELNPYFPDSYGLKGFLLLEKGEFKEAEDLFKKGIDIPGQTEKSMAYLAIAFIAQKKMDLAYNYLDELKELEKKEPGRPVYVNIANIYHELGETGKVMEYLEKAIDMKDAAIIYIFNHPQYKKYHSDPRFAKLMKRMKMDTKFKENLS